MAHVITPLVQQRSQAVASFSGALGRGLNGPSALGGSSVDMPTRGVSHSRQPC